MIDINAIRSLSESKQEIEERIGALETKTQQLGDMTERLQQLLVAMASGPRRIKMDANGRPQAIEVLDEQGNPLVSRQVVRDGQGRMLGSQ